MLNPVVSPTVTTTYTITVTDSQGFACSASDNVVISVFPQIIADAGDDDTICNPANGGSIQIGGSPTGRYENGSTGIFTYSWTSTPEGFISSEANPVVAPSQTTTYHLTVTDENGCREFDEVTITVLSELIANAGTDVEICHPSNGGEVQLNATATWGSPAYTYQWEPATGLSNPNIANPMASPNSTTVYTVTVTDSFGCTDTDQITVNVVNEVVLDITGDDLMCHPEDGGFVNLAGNATGGTGSFSYQWSAVPSYDFGGEENNPFIQVNPSITTIFTLVATDLGGLMCTTQKTFEVAVLDPIQIVLDADEEICYPVNTNNPGTTISALVSGGTGDFAYMWSTGETTQSIFVEPMTTTIYTVTITDNVSGCSRDESITIVVAAELIANAGSDQTVCYMSPVQLTGSATGGTGGGYTYSWFPATGLNNPNIQNPVYTSPAGLNQGDIVTFTLTVTDANGCISTDLVTIEVLPEIILNAGENRNVCFGTQVILGGDPTAQGGSGNYNYFWTIQPGGIQFSTNPNPTVSIDFTGSREYRLLVHDLDGNCFRSSDVTLTVIDDPVVTVSADPPQVCPGSESILTASGGDSYLWSNGETTSQISVFPATTTMYSVTVTNVCGSVVEEVTVLVHPTAEVDIDNTFATDATCADEPTGILQVSVTDSVNMYTFDLIDENGNAVESIQNVQTVIFSEIFAGTYLVQITDALNCSIVQAGPFVIDQPDLITIDEASIMYSEFLCEGDNNGFISLTANGGTGDLYYTLLLDGNPVQGAQAQNGYFTDLLPGTYNISITDDLNCGPVLSETIIIYENQFPVAVISASDLNTCVGGLVTLTASGGNVYTWSADPEFDFQGSENDAQIEVIINQNTTFFLEASNACGTDFTQISISVIPGPFVDLGEDIEVCEGVPVILDAGALADVSYLWSDGSTDQTLEVTQSGIYSVIVTDNNTLCFTEDLIEVVINPAPLALTGDDQIICLGEEVTLGMEIFDPVPANTYLWTSDPEDPSLVDTDISNPAVSPLVTTVYTLTETYTETGCFTTNSVTITVVGSSPNAGDDQTICAGTEILLGPENPIEGNIFTWTSSNQEEVFDTNVPNPAVTPLVTTTYTLVEEYTDFGCVNTASVTITVNPSPLAETGPDLDICPGDVVTLGATSGGGPIPLNTYQWTSEPFDEGMSDPTISNITVSPSQTTTYTLVETYVSTGCTTERSVVVTVHDFPPALVISDVSLCENSEINLGSDSASDDFNYLWYSEPAGFTSTDKNPVLVPSDYTLNAYNEITFFLEVSSQYCASQNQVTLTIIPAPDLLIADDTGFCSAEEAQNLSLGGDEIPGYTYLWESDTNDEFTSTEANPVVSPLVTTTYTVTVINTANGCAASESVTISISDLAFVSLQNPEICEDETAVALGENIAVSGGMEPYQYFWTDANGVSVANILNPIITAPFSSHYNLSVTDAMNCPISGQVQVSIIESPEVYLAVHNDSLRGNVSIYIGQSITFQALPANYQLYDFYIIDAHEEVDSGEFEPEIDPIPGRLVQSGSSNVYTAFELKNGQQIYVVAFDGRCSGESARVTIIVNELPNAFTPDGDGINDIFAEGLEITIFNRWGQKVYQGARGSAGWDGKYNGRKVSPGTYYYLLNIYDEDNKKTTLKGSVTVILSEFK
jgi:gliding motility-associated-like protein